MLCYTSKIVFTHCVTVTVFFLGRPHRKMTKLRLPCYKWTVTDCSSADERRSRRKATYEKKSLNQLSSNWRLKRFQLWKSDNKNRITVASPRPTNPAAALLLHSPMKVTLFFLSFFSLCDSVGWGSVAQVWQADVEYNLTPQLWKSWDHLKMMGFSDLTFCRYVFEWSEHCRLILWTTDNMTTKFQA